MCKLWYEIIKRKIWNTVQNLAEGENSKVSTDMFTIETNSTRRWISFDLVLNRGVTTLR